MIDHEASDEVVTTAGLENMILAGDEGEQDPIESEKSVEANNALATSLTNTGSDTDSSTETLPPNEDGGSGSIAFDADGVEMLLIDAVLLKDEGNNYFKSEKLDEAARAYRHGVNKIKRLNNENTGNDQIKALLVTLMTNLSLVHYKQKKYKSSVELAGKALHIDHSNVKTLYRRALARKKIGDMDGACDDLRAALQFDPQNISCKKELAVIKKDLEQLKETQKRALSKAFSNKTGSFLYVDKDTEDKRTEVTAQKEKEDQELHVKLKSEWEDDCVKLLANNQQVESFDDWIKKKKEDDERQKREKRQEEEANKSAAMQRNNVRADDSDSDSDSFTEKELAMMRGYKKTSDGRTTSYFNRELSEHERRHFENAAPQRLIDSPGHIPSRLHESSQSTPSAWNQAKTWEEKDCTDWCKKQLRLRLCEIHVAVDNLECYVSTIDELNGDASVAMAGGRKRYIFDFHVQMTYEIKDMGSKTVVSGKVRIPDISSAMHEELDVMFVDWNIQAHPMGTRTSVASEIRNKVQLWVSDFNQQY